MDVPSIDTAPLDLLYIVRPGDDNEELRYSLRSVAANLPHSRVWVAGHCPAWVRGVVRLELDPLEDKFANQRQSLAAAAADPLLSDPFVLFNDDMFVTESLARLPVRHLGPLAGYIEHLRSLPVAFRSNPWRRGLVATEALMHQWGYAAPDAYEAHTPLPFDKARLADVLDRAPHGGPFLWGCAYDACGTMPGAIGLNAKATRTLEPPQEPFASSNDRLFAEGEIGRRIRALFPEPCIYEEA